MDRHGDGPTGKQSNYDVILQETSSCHMANYIRCQAVIYHADRSAAATTRPQGPGPQRSVT